MRLKPKVAVNCRGRNGWFHFDTVAVEPFVPPIIDLKIMSIKDCNQAPIVLRGHPAELKEILNNALHMLDIEWAVIGTVTKKLPRNNQ